MAALASTPAKLGAIKWQLLAPSFSIILADSLLMVSALDSID
jgi:hypothetical protein